MSEIHFQPTEDFRKAVKSSMTRVALMSATQPGVLPQMGSKDYTEDDIRKEFGERAAQAWAAIVSARKTFLQAAQEHIDAEFAPRPYMGQIMAECDCPRPDECNQAEECLAAKKEI